MLPPLDLTTELKNAFGETQLTSEWKPDQSAVEDCPMGDPCATPDDCKLDESLLETISKIQDQESMENFAQGGCQTWREEPPKAWKQITHSSAPNGDEAWSKTCGNFVALSVNMIDEKEGEEVLTS